MIYDNKLTLGYSGEETKFLVLASTGEYGYSWSEVAILMRESDGALFLTDEIGGCSCNSFSDNCELSDMVPVKSVGDAILLARTKHSASIADGLRRSHVAGGEPTDLV